MRKLTVTLVTTFILTMMSIPVFAWSDRSAGQPNQYITTQRLHHVSEDHPFFRFGKLNGSGLYVWHDGEELHLRAVNKSSSDSERVYSGVIRTDGRFYNIEDKQLENGDYIQVNHQRNTIQFHFTGRGIDGLDFMVRGGDTVDFDLYKDGKEMPPNEICIGKDSWHPWHNNFYLER